MLAFGLSLLAIGKNIMGWLSAGVKWIFADVHRIIIAALIAACVWFAIGKGQETRRAENALTRAEAAETGLSNIKKAQEQARLAAIANAKRVEREYEEQAENAKRDYQSRLASNNATLQRWLRVNRDRGGPGQGDSASLTEGSTGVAETSSTPDILAGHVMVPVSDLELTAQAYATLESLQAWARAIGEVETAE